MLCKGEYHARAQTNLTYITTFLNAHTKPSFACFVGGGVPSTQWRIVTFIDAAFTLRYIASFIRRGVTIFTTYLGEEKDTASQLVYLPHNIYALLSTTLVI